MLLIVWNPRIRIQTNIDIVSIRRLCKNAKRFNGEREKTSDSKILPDYWFTNFTTKDAIAFLLRLVCTVVVHSRFVKLFTRIFSIESPLGQTTQPNYSCYENNSTVTFTLSSLDHSAQQTSTNCFLSTCNESSSNNSSCLSSLTPCFAYRSWNNTRYCAPAIDCSILTPCDNVTNQCASNTLVCIVNSCCSPQAVCLPLFVTEICTANPGISNSTGGLH